MSQNAWARAAALRLLRAVPSGRLLSEASRVIGEITGARTKKQRGERTAALIIALAGIAGDAAAQFANAKGRTFEQYVDELEAEVHRLM